MATQTSLDRDETGGKSSPKSDSVVPGVCVCARARFLVLFFNLNALAHCSLFLSSITRDDLPVRRAFQASKFHLWAEGVGGFIEARALAQSFARFFILSSLSLSLSLSLSFWSIRFFSFGSFLTRSIRSTLGLNLECVNISWYVVVCAGIVGGE